MKYVDKKHYLTLRMKFAYFNLKMHETIPDMKACIWKILEVHFAKFVFITFMNCTICYYLHS